MDATDICNQALDILKEAPISSLTDSRPIAKWLNRNFETTRDAALSMANWNFALKRSEIPAESDAPAFGWDYAYTLPVDCIRLIPLTQNGKLEGSPVAHVVEQGRVLTDKAGPLKIRYVARVENYNAYHPLFVEALAARLAFKMAHWLTGKVSYQQVAQGIYENAMNDAWLADAIEGDTPRPADDDWIEARY